jgi:hypothetical protein
MMKNDRPQFKAGDLVVYEDNPDKPMTVTDVRFEGRWFVRVEGDPPRHSWMASALRPYVAPVAA